jgi:hypothetical protein
MGALWDNYRLAEKNALIDAFAHELAEKIRTTVPPTAITPGGPYTNGVTWAADLIDPTKDTPR